MKKLIGIVLLATMLAACSSTILRKTIRVYDNGKLVRTIVEDTNVHLNKTDSRPYYIVAKNNRMAQSYYCSFDNKLYFIKSEYRMGTTSIPQEGITCTFDISALNG